MKESFLKVATMCVELHKIQHKSIRLVAEGIGLENYLIRNVAALCNFQCNVCLKTNKTLCRHALSEFLSRRIGSSGAQTCNSQLFCYSPRQAKGKRYSNSCNTYTFKSVSYWFASWISSLCFWYSSYVIPPCKRRNSFITKRWYAQIKESAVLK